MISFASQLLRRVLLTIAMCAALPGGLGRAQADEPIDYLHSIKPLLKARCYSCHGALKQQNGLRLDTVANIKRGGESGAAIEPGASKSSQLVDHIAQRHDAARMPPASEGEALTPAEIARIAAWIDQGAAGVADEKPDLDPKEHWAFKAPVKAAMAGEGNPIDLFLRAEWTTHQLRPQGPAEKGILLRRVYIDLIGMPPTAEQIKRFLDDSTPDVYERVVDELLASKHYGERWGRHWMDVWRYSEWYGLGNDVRNGQRHLWHWRDWIVESVNDDKGYDQMIREMLAADELYPADEDRLRATGYLVRPYFHFSRTTWLEDVVEHTSKAFLGLTLNCAKCHDHKYDPLKQEDFYKFRAFFEPYYVRTDIAGKELDFERDGVPRIYDNYMNAPTYLFERGDESRPVKDRPLAPGVPEILSFDKITIAPVKLPLESYAPGLAAKVVTLYEEDAAERRKTAERSLAHLQAELAKITPADTQRIDQAKSAIVLAEKDLAAAVLYVEVVRARAAADKARYQQPPATNAGELARQAALAEKKYALSDAEVKLAQLEVLKADLPEEERTSGRQFSRAKRALEKAKKEIDQPGEKYTSLRGSQMARTERGVEVEVKADDVDVFPATSTGRRSALAVWLTDRRNPLTARVAINHIWLRHFNKPLVPNVFDFGRNAAPPTHPELLDWLAVDLMEHGWNMKRIHRLMVTSQAYRMTSSLAAAAPESLANDPDNLYLWRMNPIRMQSQVVRDSLLQLSGELDPTLGGASILIDDDFSVRRSIYYVHSHNDHHRLLAAFDDASVLECYRRTESILPQQALALENSRLAMRTAERIARSIPTRDNAEFIKSAFQLVLGDTPSVAELIESEKGLSKFRDIVFNAYHREPDMRARINFVLALLNHNDFVTVR